MVPPFNLVSNVKSIIKLLSILAILIASMFSVSSCTEDWEDAYLAIDQNNFSISSSGETKTISIQTSNPQLSSSASFLRLNVLSSLN